MATIVVNDPANVIVDGVPSGSVTDVMANFKGVAGIRGDLLAAIEAWRAGRDQQHADAAEALRASHAGDLAAKDARIAELEAKVAGQQALIDDMGGTEVGRRMAQERRRRELLEAREAIEAELAEDDPGGSTR